ncbi:uncharacterized protein LOC131663602 [Phymastichus coffea]|uniref:uncharacterized protein LOC131663602 n=1 Tax=Phymastichus coffea TaxID=108790 RepID=UPI00273CDEFA|nr:uncharacterized protein LOC131663602 [Phymastichus coffea]
MIQDNDKPLSPWQTHQYNVVFRDPESILKTHLGEDISVVDFESESFSKIGDNYGSTMMRINVSVARKDNENIEKLQLIGKLLPPTDFQRQIFESDYTFQKEIFFYEHLIPTYQDLYMKEFNIVPQYYGSRISLEPDTNKISEDAVILLENLKVKGYYMEDRHKGLDLEHLSVIVPAIAKFHAIGLALKHKNPSFLPVLEKYIRRLNGSTVQDKFVQKLLIDIEKNSEVNQYHARIKALYDNSKGVPKTLKLTHPWACVVHLDLWNNNMLFHRDKTGKIDDVKIVDFQTYSVISPLTDLIFLLLSSMQYPMEHFDSMVELYRQATCRILKELNLDACLFEKQQFEERLKIDAIAEIIHILLMANIVECREGEDFENDPINEFTIRRLKRVFEIFERKKWL